MTLEEIISTVQFKISGGSQFMWSCYGPNARYMDFDSGFKDVTASCIFDSKTQAVYECHAYVGGKGYRWFNPDFIKKYYEESFAKGFDPRIYYDDCHYCDCEVESDILDKLKTLFQTGSCSNEIIIPLNLTKEQEDIFNSLPAGTDINQFIEEALLEKIKSMQDENIKIWQELTDNLKLKKIKLSLKDNKAPISKEAIKNIEKEVIKLKVKEIKLFYADKLTSQGIVCRLEDESGQILVNYKMQK